MKRLFLKYGIYIMLAVVLAYAAIKAPVFFTFGNMVTLLVQASVTAIMSIGMTYLILTGNIDICVGSTMFMAGVCASLVVLATNNVLLAVGVALIVGAVIGSINGILVAHLNLPSMIATLGMQGLVRGLAYLMCGGEAIMNLPDHYKAISQGSVFGFIPASIFISVIFMAIGCFVLYTQRFGHQIYAVGNNREATDACGINSRKILFCLYLISGVLSAVGGVVMTARLASLGLDMGNGMEFTCITAVALGGTSLYGGRGGMWGTIIGVLIVTALDNIMRLANVSAYLYNVVLGLVIFIAVLLDLMRRNGNKKKTINKMGRKQENIFHQIP